MSLVERLRGKPRTGRESRFADDARAMRASLDELQREAGGVSAPPDLRSHLRDLIDGEVAAPTADVAALTARDTDPDEFYSHEVAPSWEGLGERQRAARLDGLLDMCELLADEDAAAAMPPEMGASVRTKTLLLAWAYDQVHGRLRRIERGEDG